MDGSIGEDADLSIYQFAALILACVGPLLAMARHVGAPESLILFSAGILSAFVPGLPAVGVDPDLALSLFLPPLVYAATVRVSWHLLRLTLGSGVILGAALVLVTIVAVAVATRTFLLPGLSWTGALLVGVVASVFDTRLFHEAEGRPRVPRAVADVLKARELVSRLMILASLALAEQAIGEGRITGASILDKYLLDVPAGILLGVAVGYAIVWARRRIDPAPVEIAVSVATPYAAALSAEALGISSVAAITSAALVVSAIRIDRRTGVPISSSEARISATAFWEEASLIVSSVLFFLAGRALPQALAALEDWRLGVLVLAAAGVLAVVVAVQFVFALAATWLPPIAGDPRVRAPGHRAAVAGVMAWSSTRSVIGLLIALSIPAALPGGEPFRERDLILVVAALMVVGSILVQGLTLRAAVARAALLDEAEEEREEEDARRAIEAAASAQGRRPGAMHDAARRALLELRERDRIGDEVLARMLRETDLHARASEDSALPGAGPPNP